MRHRPIAILAGLLAVGIAIVVASVVGAGLYLVKPVRQTVSKPSFLAAAEDVTIQSPSGPLRGWFVSGKPGGGAVVLMHGYRATRLSMARRACLLRQDGFAVLLFDFQAHGESGGDRITLGIRESDDARAAVDFLRKRLPGERLGALGASLGGASVLLGSTILPVDALVLESVYPDMHAALLNRFIVFLGPARPFSPAAAWLFEMILPPVLGIRLDQLRPIDRIGAVTAPMLVAVGTVDDRTTVAETEALFAAARAPKQLWLVKGAGHVDLERAAPEAYRANVLAFLRQYLQAALPLDQQAQAGAETCAAAPLS